MKKKFAVVFLALSLMTLSGCQAISNWFKNAEEEWIGLQMTVRTYDENSQLIDQMSGKSLFIARNQEFDSVDAEGNSREDSSVLKITLGKYEIDHVGSSLIAEEEGLTDVYAKYQKTVDISVEYPCFPRGYGNILQIQTVRLSPWLNTPVSREGTIYIKRLHNPCRGFTHYRNYRAQKN